MFIFVYYTGILANMDQVAGAARKHGRKALAAGAAILLGIMVLLWPGGVNAPGPAKQASNQNQAAEAKQAVQSRILFVGDIYWGRYINKKAQSSPLKETYPFSRLNEFDRASYDAWVGNLECPSVPGANQPYSVEVQKLLFNCPATYLPEFAKWFTVVSLANNHTSNQGGQAGLNATRQALDKQGLQYFGHYDPTALDDVCEIAALPAKSGNAAAYMPVAFCGYHGLVSAPSAESLDRMRDYAKYMPVIAYVHMGSEYTATVDKTRQALYRSMVDKGADAVIGGHPHWVQPAEVYKGKLIAYSLGNFMFDQKPGETSRGAAITLALRGEAQKGELDKWSKVSASCVQFRDDCLETIQKQKQKLTRMAFTFDYVAQSVDMSGYRPHPGDDTLDQLVLERLSWAKVEADLRAGQ